MDGKSLLKLQQLHPNPLVRDAAIAAYTECCKATLVNVHTTSTGRVGGITLVAGTKAISITGITSSSLAFVTRTVASGTTLTTGITAVCTSGTLTITADVAAGTINTADTSTYNYFVIN